jgi:HK97 family phage major capsid protein
MNMLENIEVRDAPVENLDDATRAVNELRTAADAFRTELQTENRALTARLAALETRLARPAIIRPENMIANDRPLHVRAFDAFVRGHDANLVEPEVRAAMTTATSGAGGGYLVPPEFLAEIDRNLILYSPMRSLARIMQVSTPQVLLPKRTANMVATWEGETDAEPESEGTYGQNDLAVYEMKAFSDISNRLLEDSAFDLNAEMAIDFGQAFGQKEGQAFVSGTGDTYKQPLGLIGSTITTTTTAGTAAITAAELIDFFYSLPSPYAANATWVANRQTIGYLRQIVNTAGFYVWQGPLAGIDQADPNTLLGRPVVEFPDMPNIGAGNIPVAFGDFKSGFRIADRLAILRDPYSQATASNVRFHGRRRVGGMVTKAEAIRLLANHA